jgi:hypothetical protein
VEELDKQHATKSRTVTGKPDSGSAGENSSNKFNRFGQRSDIDFDELEKKLVKN